MGAKRYEFTLSTSALSAGSGLVWDDSSLTSPAAAVRIALPWITGRPFSLYARVRAISETGRVGRWSAAYGFNVRWTDVPTQLPAPDGLVRWSTVDGATSYEIWYQNANVSGRSKLFYTTTNVADEREYYAFHQFAPFTTTVIWRVRAVRAVYGAAQNKLPAVTYGPWSAPFTSTNGAFPSGTRISAGATISGLAGQQQTHQLMPAFTFGGTLNSNGSTSNLYRVYVYTDSDCVNLVFKSAIVGSPAYAPRSSGPLALPHDQSGITAARTTFLPDGHEGATFMFDGEPILATEDQAPSVFTPQTTVPGAPAAPSTAPASGGSSGSPGAGAPGGTGGVDPNAFPATLSASGAPIDLWDTTGSGRYYWTVVGVTPVTRTTNLVSGVAVGSHRISVSSASEFIAGDAILIGNGPNQEAAVVSSVDGTELTLSQGLALPHSAGELVVRQAGSVEYFDADIPQDVCAAGRIGSFGKDSQSPESRSAASSLPYASGLAPNGRLAAAADRSPAFYGAPLVAWKPALSATAYELQWSKTSYPWRPVSAPYYTFSTEATLPLSPGRWYYRVRGIDLSLPSGAQQMDWSKPTAIVVARPKFKVVPK
jgi:hypothetical protein